MYPKNPARELIQCLESDHWADSENQDRSGEGQRGSPRSLPKPRYRQTPLLPPPDIGNDICIGIGIGVGVGIGIGIGVCFREFV